MYIKFLSKIWCRLKHESDVQGVSIQQVVQNALIDYYNLD